MFNPEYIMLLAMIFASLFVYFFVKYMHKKMQYEKLLKRYDELLDLYPSISMHSKKTHIDKSIKRVI